MGVRKLFRSVCPGLNSPAVREQRMANKLRQGCNVLTHSYMSLWTLRTTQQETHQKKRKETTRERIRAPPPWITVGIIVDTGVKMAIKETEFYCSCALINMRGRTVYLESFQTKVKYQSEKPAYGSCFERCFLANNYTQNDIIALLVL